MRAVVAPALLAAALIAGCGASGPPAAGSPAAATPTVAATPEASLASAPTPEPTPTVTPTPTPAPPTPSPTSTPLPLASILTGSYPKASESQAASAIKKAFSAHPDVAREFKRSGENIPLRDLAIQGLDRCMQVARANKTQWSDFAGDCWETWRALWVAYLRTGDTAFLSAGRSALGALRGAASSSRFAETVSALKESSDFLLTHVDEFRMGH
jgi:hypothetical protein